jgi:Fe-S-cluster containining protein
MHLRKTEILGHFRCQKSGNCCKAGGYVYVDAAELTQMATLMGLSPTDFRERYVVRQNGWDLIATPTHRPRCFLDDQDRCTVYSARPAACRSYPDWPELWASEAQLLAECQTCPGLRQAVEALNREDGIPPV